MDLPRPDPRTRDPKDVGNFTKVARDHVSALFIYRRKTLTARVLLTLPLGQFLGCRNGSIPTGRYRVS